MNDKLYELVEATLPNSLMPNLKKLTVIVPIFSRQELIFRQIAHWHGCGSKLIILDGSQNQLDTKSVDFINSYTDVSYLHVKESFSTRMSIATKYIDTAYTVFSPDDYFHSPSGAEAIIDHLEKEQSICACTGQSVHSLIDKTSLNIRFTSFANRFCNYQAANDNYHERLKYAFNKYNAATNFSIMRSEVWKKSWGSLDAKYSSTNIYEIEQAFSVYVSGKFSSLNVFGFLTTNEFYAINNIEDNRTLLFEHWWTSDKFRFEKKYFVNKLSLLVSSQEGISLKSASVLIYDVIDLFVQNKFNFSIIHENHKISPQLIKFFESSKSILPNTAYNFLRELFITFSSNKKYMNLEKFLKSNTYLLKNDDYTNEVKKIKDLILRFQSIYQI